MASPHKDYRLRTPKNGEPVWLDGRQQRLTSWWKGIS